MTHHNIFYKILKMILQMRGCDDLNNHTSQAGGNVPPLPHSNTTLFDQYDNGLKTWALNLGKSTFARRRTAFRSHVTDFLLKLYSTLNARYCMVTATILKH